MELAQFSRRLSEARTHLELKAIGGWRAGPWLLAGNVNVRRNFGREATRAWRFAPSAKLTYEIGDGLAIGFERYHELDRVGRPSSLERVNYLVTDVTIKGVALNFGVSQGSGEGADKWVAKFIVGMHL